MRKSIRSVKIESVEDIEALPEGEWVHVPDGMKVKIVYDDGVLERPKTATGPVRTRAASGLAPKRTTSTAGSKSKGAEPSHGGHRKGRSRRR